MINVSAPFLNGKESEYVIDALASNELSWMGKYLEKFEDAMAQLCETQHALATSSGTSALHLALIACGVKAGDRVIVPAMTYVATANAVMYCNATPIFCEVDESWCMDVKDVEALFAQYKNIAAIIPVHLYGNVANMQALYDIAKKNKAYVIEDAAQAFGSRWQDHHVGGLADIGVFSLYANKLVTSGEGGCVVTSNTGLAEAVRLYRGQCQTQKFYHTDVGFNYRLTNLQAAVALAQLETLERRVARHEEIRAQYHEGLNDFETSFKNPNASNACWLYTALVPKGVRREKLMKALYEVGIETRPTFVPLTQLPMYAQTTPERCEDIGARGISLPTHSGLLDKQVQYVIDSVKDAVTR